MLIDKGVSAGEVVTLKLTSGEEIVAKLTEETATYYKLSKPMVIGMGQKGPGLMPYLFTVSPDKEIKLPSQDVCFQLEHASLEKLLKAAAVYQLPDLSAVGEAGVIRLVVRDKKNDTSNEYSIVVGETDNEFTFNFKVENIKIIPGASSLS